MIDKNKSGDKIIFENRLLGGMFRRGNCHVKIIQTFARTSGGFYV